MLRNPQTHWIILGKKDLLYTPLLKWYLDHGMIITQTYSFIKASSHTPFKRFEAEVSDKQQGDEDPNKGCIADMMKLVGNAAFGRSGMDKSKHKSIKYTDDIDKLKDEMEHFTFHHADEVDGIYEIKKHKRRINLNNPIHVSIAIYQLAKLRMLQFYYDLIDKHIDDLISSILRWILIQHTSASAMRIHF